MHNVRTFLAFKIPFLEPEIPNPPSSNCPPLPSLANTRIAKAYPAHPKALSTSYACNYIKILNCQ